MYNPPRDDYATTPGNAQILFTCLPLMASWLVISTYKLIHQWSRGAAGQTQHVIQVTIYVVYIQQITENVLIFLHYSRDDGLF